MDARHVRYVVAMLLVASCGSGTGSGGIGDSERDRLLAVAVAVAAADANSGEARREEVVKTTRGEAADLTGHSNQAQAEEVYVVQVSGDDYTCQVCRRPPGASSPKGRFITVVLRASDYEGTDSGLGPTATDLARFGKTKYFATSDRWHQRPLIGAVLP